MKNTSALALISLGLMLGACTLTPDLKTAAVAQAPEQTPEVQIAMDEAPQKLHAGVIVCLKPAKGISAQRDLEYQMQKSIGSLLAQSGATVVNGRSGFWGLADTDFSKDPQCQQLTLQFRVVAFGTTTREKAAKFRAAGYGGDAELGVLGENSVERSPLLGLGVAYGVKRAEEYAARPDDPLSVAVTDVAYRSGNREVRARIIATLPFGTPEWRALLLKETDAKIVEIVR